jgi:DNA polymerase-3 subunit delta
MNWEQFVRALRGEPVDRAYLLTGDDRYLKTQCIEQLQSALFPQGKGEVGRYQAPEELANAARDAQTYPFFTGMRLVIIERAERITAEAKKTLAPVLESPPDFACIVLVTGEDVGAKRWPKWVKETTSPVECKADPKSIRKWIAGWFRKQGLGVEAGALTMLTKRSGGRFGVLIGDLEKLSLLCPAGGTVTEAMVRDEALDHSEEGIFTLTGALLEQDRDRGIQALEDLLRQGDPPGQILVMLAKSVKLRWALSDPDAPRNDEEIARGVRLSPRWVSTARRRGEKADRGLAYRLWTALEEADGRMKTSAYSDSTVLLASLAPAFAPPSGRKP